MAGKIEIEGIGELHSFLQNHTKELDKSVLQSLTKGGNILKAEFKNQMPSALSKFGVTLKVKGLKAAIPTVLVGFFGRMVNYVNRRGVNWDAFMLVYWANYGTMANRDRTHIFQKARRSKSINKKGGIIPMRFFDKSVDLSFGRAIETAANDINNTIDKLADKFGFK